MNLLQELHETTMMMNMYQQQQLQQEQLRLQQNEHQLGGMAQRQGSLGGGSTGGMDAAMFASQRGSLGLGMGPRGSLGLGPGMGGGAVGLSGGGGSKPQQSGMKEDAEALLARMKRSSENGDGVSTKRSKMSSGDGS